MWSRPCEAKTLKSLTTNLNTGICNVRILTIIRSSTVLTGVAYLHGLKHVQGLSSGFPSDMVKMALFGRVKTHPIHSQTVYVKITPTAGSSMRSTRHAH